MIAERRSVTNTMSLLLLVLLAAACSNTAGPPPAASQDAPAPVLTVDFKGDGHGSVTSIPEGLACPGACRLAQPAGTHITLQATPADGSFLGGWIGECTAVPGGTCNLVLERDVTITAVFVMDLPEDYEYPDEESGAEH